MKKVRRLTGINE